MVQFITVLRSAAAKSYWEAVQWDDNLNSLNNNPYYTAGVSLSVPKHEGDRQLNFKTIIESATQYRANALVFQVAPRSAELILLAEHTAPDHLLAEIK